MEPKPASLSPILQNKYQKKKGESLGGTTDGAVSVRGAETNA